MADTTSDSAVLAASVEAPEEFGTLFDRYYDEIRAYAWRRLGDAAADDIAAETFARAFAGRERFTPEYGSARPWLYGIATNLIRMHVRGEKRRLRAHARSPLDQCADHASAAADRASAERQRADLLRALAGLGRRDREIVLLRAWAELTSKEIGLALGLPDATVRTRLARARKKLADGLTTPEKVAALAVLPAEGVER